MSINPDYVKALEAVVEAYRDWVYHIQMVGEDRWGENPVPMRKLCNAYTSLNKLKKGEDV